MQIKRESDRGIQMSKNVKIGFALNKFYCFHILEVGRKN